MVVVIQIKGPKYVGAFGAEASAAQEEAGGHSIIWIELTCEPWVGRQNYKTFLHVAEKC